MSRIPHFQSPAPSPRPALARPARPLPLLHAMAAVICILAAPLAMAGETKSSISEPTRAETQLRCFTWRTHLTRLIDLQEHYAVITTALAQGLRAEIDRLDLRCAVERPQAVLDRYTAIDTFLYDETQDQLLINPAEFSCDMPN